MLSPPRSMYVYLAHITYIYMYTFVYVCLCVVCVCISATHTHIHTHTRTCTHTRISTHKHTAFNSQKLKNTAVTENTRQDVLDALQAKHSTVEAIVRGISQRLGLSLFGFDLLLHSQTQDLYIVDVNYFPVMYDMYIVYGHGCVRARLCVCGVCVVCVCVCVWSPSSHR